VLVELDCPEYQVPPEANIDTLMLVRGAALWPAHVVGCYEFPAGPSAQEDSHAGEGVWAELLAQDI
jgi:hypothetical protein